MRKCIFFFFFLCFVNGSNLYRYNTSLCICVSQGGAVEGKNIECMYVCVFSRFLFVCLFFFCQNDGPFCGLRSLCVLVCVCVCVCVCQLCTLGLSFFCFVFFHVLKIKMLCCGCFSMKFQFSIPSRPHARTLTKKKFGAIFFLNSASKKVCFQTKKKQSDNKKHSSLFFFVRKSFLAVHGNILGETFFFF